MKKVFILMVLVAMVFATGCKKDPNNGEQGGSEPTAEGIYLGVIGFNSQLYVKEISLLNNSTKSSFTNFIDGLTSGNGTGLYYADYTALKKMNAYTKPPKLKNVALVTFTDGLDNVSTATSETDPENYGSTSAYREALHNKIVNEKIHGFNVAAYTIGLKGNDVTDETQFNETLRKLASNNNNVFQVANMNEAMQRLSEIAENLYSVSTTVSLGVDVPGGYDDGQMLRFTFDEVSAATSSTRYIEAKYRRNGNSRTLENVSYVGFTQGLPSISSSSVQGVYYHFQFGNLTYTNGNTVSQTDINRIKLWKKTSNGGWDRETEFDPASSSTMTEDKSSALIMLVLDCTNSLGSDFNKMQQGGNKFVDMLVNSNSGGSGGSGGGNESGDTTPLTEYAFTWNRHGSNAATGLAEFGLEWYANVYKAIYAVIKPMPGAKLYKFASSVYSDVTTAAEKAAAFEGVTEIQQWKEFNVAGAPNQTMDVVLGTEYQGEFHLIHITNGTVESGSFGVDATITGMAK